MMKLKVAIAGVSGITATQLLKLLDRHRFVEVKYLLSSSVGGDASEKNFHALVNQGTKLLSTFDTETYKVLAKQEVDLLFLCLPHKISMEFLRSLINSIGTENLPRIIDLSADFRIKNVNLYEKFYGCPHQLPDLLEQFVYGLPECEPERKQKIKNTNFVANPGCYPTTVILGLAPIIGKFEFQDIIIDAKSGYSGGGKKLVEEYESYGGNNTYPYNADGKHRHIPEIKEQLSELAKKNINFLFTPYVVPQYQGMLTTMYLKIVDCKLQTMDLYFIYKNYYANHFFVRVLPPGELAQTKKVIGTNYCDISFVQEEGTSWVKVFVAIDNLIKGAVGQAVQNMNIMFDFDETEGLV